MFDKKAFEASYKKGLASVARGEKAVREALNPLSREILTAVHATENIGYVNNLLQVLTPVNRKGAVTFFKRFTGFSYDETIKLFTKKSKKRYDQAHKEAMEFLVDPLNNMFSWCARHVEVEEKPFNREDFTKGFKKMWDKRLQDAKDNGITQRELFYLLFKGEQGKPGIDINVMLDVLAELAEPVKA